MDKEILFRFLRTRFGEAGFTPEEIDVHISHFSDRYSGKSDDEIEADIKNQGGPSKVADRVIKRRNTVLMQDRDYRAFVGASEGPNKIPADPSRTAVSHEETETVRTYTPTRRSEAAQSPADDAEQLQSWFGGTSPDRAEGGDALPPVYRKPSPPPTDEPAPTQKPAGTSAPKVMPHFAPQSVEDPAHAKQKREPYDNMGNTKVISVPPAPTKSPKSSRPAPMPLPEDSKAAHIPAPTGGSTSGRLADRTYWGEATEEGYRRFWILFAVSLPFAILILLALAVLAGGIVLGIVALIVGLIALLVAEVAAGAAISLVGIIYGVSQIYLAPPIGVFEMGIGVTVAGITMLAGILIYNLAVRFLPFVLKQFIRFLKFFKRFLGDLYYYLKGECYRR